MISDRLLTQDLMQALIDDGRIARLPGGRIIELENCVAYIGDETLAWIRRKLDR